VLDDPLDKSALTEFETKYSAFDDAIALGERDQFLKRFPRERLVNLTVEEYVLGRGDQTFCYMVGVSTTRWASIRGGLPSRFGVYFGREKPDLSQKYRFTKKFGTNERQAFATVKEALIDLVRRGSEDNPAFAALDANPLSQAFKAKILSLYFPERFLAVCSKKHLGKLASVFHFAPGQPLSKYQCLLLKAKSQHPRTSTWTNPKFMAFLYKTYGRRMDWGGADRFLED
jgi:hypothetical protein